MFKWPGRYSRKSGAIMQIQWCHGREIAPFIPDLARLRIAVFRDFPYLYDGTTAYEEDYLATYAQSPESLFVLAVDGGAVVGAATGLPLRDETDAFRAPFVAVGRNPEDVFYFGESVLLPAFRGRGLGVRFFAEREAWARHMGRFKACAFSAVERPHDHPLRPAGYVPLDAFWNRRGYVHHPELRTSFVWQDVDEAQPTPKPMSFWLKEIR